MILSILLTLPLAWADSPLTSVSPHHSYEDDPLVRRALELGSLDRRLTRFLLRGEHDLDRKVAVLSALGWSIDGRDEASTLLAALAHRHKQPKARLLAEPTLLSPSEAFLLGYRLALDDYFEPARTTPLLERARLGLPHSRTVALISVMAETQALMATDWCAVWTLGDAVLSDPDLRPDLHFAVEEEARAYFALYQRDCPDPDEEEEEEVE